MKNKRPIKNDTCLKRYQLANTMFFSNEEFGILIRKIIIDDDDNFSRFETLNSMTKETYLKKEKEWLKDFENTVNKNPLILQPYNTIYGQLLKSKEAYYRYGKGKEETKTDNQRYTVSLKILKTAEIDYENGIVYFEPAESPIGETVEHLIYDKEQFADIGFYVGDNKAHDFVVDFNEGKLIDYV